MNIAALIVAAGRGARVGAARSKVFLPIAGTTILARAIDVFLRSPCVNQVVVAVADEAEARAALGAIADRIRFVRGGQQRQDSVRRALEAVPAAEIVLVHDAARPLVSAVTIEAVLEATRRHGAAIPALAVAETIKRVGDDGSVAATVPRDDLVLAQTPQGFRRDLLANAYEQAERDGFRGTDDASLVERTGARVMVVEGDIRNIKITRPPDLQFAELLLSGAHPDRGATVG